MSLRWRLFLTIGLLLLGMTATVYLIPSYLGEKRVSQVRQQAEVWLHKRNEERNQQVGEWLKSALYGLKAGVDGYLFLVSRTPTLTDAFANSGENSVASWKAAAHLMMYSSHLNFVQNQSSDDSTTLVAIGGARLYPVLRTSLGQNLQWVMTEADEGGGPYIGILAPADSPGYPNRCFLFEPSELLTLSAIIKKQIEANKKSSDPDVQAILEELAKAEEILTSASEAAKVGDPQSLSNWINSSMNEHEAQFSQLPEAELLGQARSNLGGVSPYLGLTGSWGEAIQTQHSGVDNDVFVWRVIQQAERLDEMSMVQDLGALLSAGLLASDVTTISSLAGVAKFQPSAPIGIAILSHDVVSTKAVFDGAAHLKAHPPASEGPPMGSALGLVANLAVREVSAVNTVKLTGANGAISYLTVGTPIAFLVSELSQHSDAAALAVYQGKVVSGFGVDGALLDPSILESFEHYLAAGGSQQGDTLMVNNEQYITAAFSPVPEWGITFYTVRSSADFYYLVNWITKEAKGIVKEASRRLFMISFGILILALIVLEIIAKQVTKPISTLAQATQLVIHGKYDSVVLPHVPDSTRNEVSVLTAAFKKMVRGLIDRERIRAVLNKCISKEVADEILSQDIELGGEVKEAAVLFADIRNFTGITEKMEPQDVIALLNEYMTWVSEIIDGHRGVIDKYIGDEVMALYGAPLPMEHAALQATVTAILLMEYLKKWNSEREARSLIPIDIGIGIHYGTMVAGNMGGEQRQNYTVLGANVNLASRLCSEALPMEILITEEMYRQPEVAVHIEIEDHGEMQFKGFSAPMKTYRVVGFKDRQGLEQLGIRT